MQDTGSLELELPWDEPEGWYGEGGGRGLQDWEHVYTHGGFMLMYGKINFIFKMVSDLLKEKHLLSSSIAFFRCKEKKSK